MSEQEPISPDILQAIRKAHCAKGKDAAHACAGTCIIAPEGITLACELCGDGGESTVASHTSDAAERVRAVLEAVGLDYEKLAPETQRDAIEEMASDYCPGCRRIRTISGACRPGFYHCPCGSWIHSGIAWSKEGSAVIDRPAR